MPSRHKKLSRTEWLSIVNIVANTIVSLVIGGVVALYINRSNQEFQANMVDIQSEAALDVWQKEQFTTVRIAPIPEKEGGSRFNFRITNTGSTGTGTLTIRICLISVDESWLGYINSLSAVDITASRSKVEIQDSDKACPLRIQGRQKTYPKVITTSLNPKETVEIRIPLQNSGRFENKFRPQEYFQKIYFITPLNALSSCLKSKRAGQLRNMVNPEDDLSFLNSLKAHLEKERFIVGNAELYVECEKCTGSEDNSDYSESFTILSEIEMDIVDDETIEGFPRKSVSTVKIVDRSPNRNSKFFEIPLYYEVFCSSDGKLYFSDIDERYFFAP